MLSGVPHAQPSAFLSPVFRMFTHVPCVHPCGACAALFRVCSLVPCVQPCAACSALCSVFSVFRLCGMALIWPPPEKSISHCSECSSWAQTPHSLTYLV